MEEEYSFAAKLKEIRQRRGLQQKELGEKMRLNHNRISNWELGYNKPNIDVLRDLCIALNASADELLGLPTEELVEKLYLLDEDGRHSVEAIIDSQLRRMGK